MSRSLQRRLSRTLAVAIVLSGLLAALASFGFAYFEAQEFQDDTLRQIAVLTAGTPSETKATASARLDVTGGAINDLESRVVIIRLPQDLRPAWLPDDLTPGFHTLANGPERMRVFVRDLKQGRRFVVAQATDARDEIAINSALRTLVPPLLLLPLLVWLIVHIIGSELAPVQRLAQSLDKQSAERPQPLPDSDIPDEISPFVHAINRLLDRINRLIDRQRRFIADAAHELRSPLTALSVQAQNLDKATSLEVMRERLVPLKAGIDRARKLTEQLLSLAKTQAGTAQEAKVDVSKMARELIAEYLPVADARGIDLGLEEAAQLTVMATPETLRLILKNALDNALRYTPKQGEVTLHLLADSEYAVMEVVDTGPGIPASERERVFDPFYRMAESASNGSGLGLAIAREAAARLGGKVSLHDRRDGPGLLFRYRQRRVA